MHTTCSFTINLVGIVSFKNIIKGNVNIMTNNIIVKKSRLQNTYDKKIHREN